MGLFDKFKKNKASETTPNEVSETTPNEPMIDDITFIGEIRHLSNGTWHQYDVLLAASGYGWEAMLDWADYMANADLQDISQVTFSSIAGAEEEDITDSYHKNNSKCKQTPELKTENGTLSVAGISKALNAPMKIIWVNQTNVLRLFTIIDDQTLITKYVETVVRRTFGTPDAMKLAKPLPKKK